MTTSREIAAVGFDFFKTLATHRQSRAWLFAFIRAAVFGCRGNLPTAPVRHGPKRGALVRACLYAFNVCLPVWLPRPAPVWFVDAAFARFSAFCAACAGLGHQRSSDQREQTVRDHLFRERFAEEFRHRGQSDLRRHGPRCPVPGDLVFHRACRVRCDRSAPRACGGRRGCATCRSQQPPWRIRPASSAGAARSVCPQLPRPLAAHLAAAPSPSLPPSC